MSNKHCISFLNELRFLREFSQYPIARGLLDLRQQLEQVPTEMNLTDKLF